MRTDDFDFHLPERLIALRPAEPRDSARLLLVPPTGPFEDRLVSELPGLLRAGDALVFNDTRVIPARLAGVRARAEGEARIEATLLRRLDDRRWTALARPAKRLRLTDVIRFGGLAATVTGRGEAGQIELEFDASGESLDEAIAREGVMPLPPYIASRRAADARDAETYQTVYAREGESVAAPTAGLHFTPALLDALSQAGVRRCFVTLHVGAGTFLPVKTDAVADHKMHAEWGEVSEAAAETLNGTRRAGGRVVCVGTTSLRLIESAAGDEGTIRPFTGETDIFITPGYRFRAADGLMTNFHLPRSTLFMLVSAFSGLERMRAAYAHAIGSGYQFYSYGDASLLWRAEAGTVRS